MGPEEEDIILFLFAQSYRLILSNCSSSTSSFLQAILLLFDALRDVNVLITTRLNINGASRLGSRSDHFALNFHRKSIGAIYSTYDESGSEEIVMDILNNLFLFKLN